MTRRVAALVVALGASGCAYKVSLTALPTTATVELPRDLGTVVTPSDVVFRWAPWSSEPIRVSADGFRPVEVDLREREIRWIRYVTDTVFRPATLFGASRAEVRVVLVPEHGPVGTWNEADTP